MTGVVVKSMGKWYAVRDGDGVMWQCRIRGKMRMKGLRHTNPIAVGDHVIIEPEEGDEGQAVILEIEERKNYIVRRSVNLSKETHIVASNIDVAFLLVTIARPRTSLGFIDRFLVVADAYDIPTVIVFNKIDEYSEEERQVAGIYREIYEGIGYTCLDVSALHGQGVDEVADKMKGKQCMVGGHSGAGKSTLINAINPELNIRTSEVSDYHEKGKHTTTFAEMHELGNGGYIIDTPGIKGFGIVTIPRDQLHHHFPEMFDLLPECKFHNCLHLAEPGCAVKAAVESGAVAESRYNSYLSMYEEDEGPYRTVNY
ncbi:MAG: ribosome small subunit-dependent GTPase A [Flavobacteriales bacterium]|nr:ribosome small subunit-dependent GTPase A [Flavobacteriales bacterium]